MHTESCDRGDPEDTSGGSGPRATNGRRDQDTPTRRLPAASKDAVLASDNYESPTNASVTPARKSSKCLAKEDIFLHDKLKWLQKDHCKYIISGYGFLYQIRYVIFRDKKGRGVVHMDYDPRTLQVYI